MARLTAPLLSLGASGSIAKALVFSSWKGIPYARVHIVPANPNTADQQEVRGVFSTLTELWKRMATTARRPFIAAVRGLALTPRNRHIQANVAELQGDANLDDLVMAVSSGQAVPPASATAADSGGQILTITPIAASPPLGYTLQRMSGAAILDGDPSPVLIRGTTEGFDLTPPYSIVLNVGVAGIYQWGVWGRFLRDSDGLDFYSTAIRGTQVIA